MKWRVKLWMFALATMTLLSVAAAAQTGTGGRGGDVGGAPAQIAPAPAPFTPSAAFKTPVEKRSYALGLDLGRQLKKQSLEVDSAQFTQGFKDALAGNQPLMSDEEVRATIVALQNEMRAKQAQAMKEMAEKNKQAGEEFLAENKKKDRSGDAAQRITVQDPAGRRRQEAHRRRYSGVPVPRHPDRRQGIRQLF